MGFLSRYIDGQDGNTGPDGLQAVALALQQNIEPLLQAGEVDLAFWGHHHSNFFSLHFSAQLDPQAKPIGYQRTCPVFNQTCVSQGTVHAVIGNAGQDLSSLESTMPSYMVYVNATYGYSYISVNSTYLKLESLSDIDNSVLDEFTLTK